MLFKFEYFNGLYIYVVSGGLFKNYNKLYVDINVSFLLVDVEEELVCDCDDEEWQSINNGCVILEGNIFDNFLEEVENYLVEK